MKRPNPPREPKPKPGAIVKAVELLSRREHSKRELRSKLRRGGYEKEEIESSVDKVVERNYQSDDRFGGVIARTRVAQGYGPARIRAELKSHGLADAAIRAAVDATDADWPLIAAAQLKRRFGAKPAADAAERGRRAQFLLRRGFDPATVRTVTRAEIGDPEEEFD